MSVTLQVCLPSKQTDTNKKSISHSLMAFLLTLYMGFGTVYLAKANPLDISSLVVPTSAPIALQFDMLTDPPRPALPLRPESLLVPSNAEAFMPYAPLSITPHARSVWLRARIASHSRHLLNPLVVDLQALFANQFSGTPTVWVLPHNDPSVLAPMPIKTNLTGFYPLPKAPDGMTVFIHLPSPPSIAFAPVIRTEASLTRLDRYGQAVILVSLAFLLLLSLVRGVAEHREWRIWSALYIGSLFVLALWGAPKVVNGFVRLWDLPALLAPGLALLLLPHVGRHILRTRDFAPKVDTYLTLCAIPGLLCTIIPLIPQQAWTLPLLTLWPLYAIIILPALVITCVRKLPGAKRFLLSVLILPLGLLPLINLFDAPFKLPIPSDIAALMPLLAMLSSAAVLAFASTPKSLRGAIRNPKANTQGQDKQAAHTPIENMQLEMPTSITTSGSVPKESETSHRQTEPVNTDLLPLFEQLFQTLSALEQHSLPAETTPHIQALTDIGRAVSNKVYNNPRVHKHANVLPNNVALNNDMSEDSEQEPFNLHALFLSVHNAVSEQAEKKNLALAWFTAPHLMQSYEGPRKLLEASLLALLQSAVHATRRGMVQIRAQRVPESTDPGHLLFTISDTGSGMPPLQRNAFALIKTWEMIAPSEGTLRLESDPTGTTIAFSMHLKVLQDMHGLPSPHKSIHCLPKPLSVIVVSDVPSTRELLAYYLDELPHEIQEARSPGESFELYKNCPGAIFIFDGDMDMSSMQSAIANIRIFEGDHDFPLASIVALVSSYDQGDMLRYAGCTHILLKPISRIELRHLILRIAPVSKNVIKSAVSMDETLLERDQERTLSQAHDKTSQQTSMTPQEDIAGRESLQLTMSDAMSEEITKPDIITEDAITAEQASPILHDAGHLDMQGVDGKIKQSQGLIAHEGSLEINMPHLKTAPEAGPLNLSAGYLSMQQAMSAHEAMLQDSKPSADTLANALEMPREPIIDSTHEVFKQFQTEKPPEKLSSPSSGLPSEQPLVLSNEASKVSSSPQRPASVPQKRLVSAPQKRMEEIYTDEISQKKVLTSLDQAHTHLAEIASTKPTKGLSLFEMVDFEPSQETNPQDEATAATISQAQADIQVNSAQKKKAIASTKKSKNSKKSIEMEVVLATCKTYIKDMYRSFADDDLPKIHQIATQMAQLTGRNALYSLKGHANCLADAARDKDTEALRMLLQDMEDALQREAQTWEP